MGNLPCIGVCKRPDIFGTIRQADAYRHSSSLKPVMITDPAYPPQEKAEINHINQKTENNNGKRRKRNGKENS